MLPTKNCVCQSCTSPILSFFYEAKNVPVNSCMMFSSHEEAVSFPRGDIQLGFCKSCGFISNLAFDESKLDYSTLSPEEQGFSGTFKIFAQKLVTRLIQTYDLKNKNVSEIGCGRGDFLAQLCELGSNFGVGIDPSEVIGKLPYDYHDSMMFIRDYYSERYSKYLGKFVACRHTLEHISKPADFINSIRSGIKSNDVYIFFEVPDVSRILEEVSFWDIFYDHCSYFSLGSLARLFRLCNFEVVNLLKDYFSQYLLIEAKPVLKKSFMINEKEESIETMAKSVELFSIRCQDKVNRWKQQLKKLQLKKKRTVVWGSGSKCVAFMTTIGIKDEIEYIVDINPNRHGKFIPGVGKQIMSPLFLKEYKPNTVIVMNPVYCDEIKKDLENMDVNAELIPCI